MRANAFAMAAQADPAGCLYAVLGVRRDADTQTIRSAYRRLAVRYHPDKNREPGAEEMFKAVARAYEVLADADSRALYDAYGMEGVQAGGPPGGLAHGGADGRYGGAYRGFDAGRHFVDPFELFSHFFGGTDPFAHVFGGAGALRRAASGGGGRGVPFEDPFFGGMGSSSTQQGLSAGGLLQQMMGGWSGTSSSSSMTFSSSSLGGGGNISRSTSSATVIQNGQRVRRTITTVHHADGTVTTEESEMVDSPGSEGNYLRDAHTNAGGRSGVGPLGYP